MTVGRRTLAKLGTTFCRSSSSCCGSRPVLEVDTAAFAAAWRAAAGVSG